MLLYREMERAEAQRIAEIDAYCFIKNAWRMNSDTGRYELIEIDWTETELPNGLQWHLRRFEQALAAGGSAYGCFDGGALVGYTVMGGEIFGQNERYLLLDQLFVSYKYRGSGIGRELFMMCAQKAARLGAEKLYICAGSSEDTMAFYDKLGCIPAAEVDEKLYADDPNDIQLEFALDKGRARLETERLRLREMCGEDYSALYRVLADSDIMQHYPYIFDESRVMGWINRNIERYRTDGFGLWAVVLKETGELIGDCGITYQSINGCVQPEIGYHIRKDCQNSGYATEAAAECMRYGFEELCLDELFSYMKSTNAASQRVAVKNGMRFREEYTDEDGDMTSVFSVTREEWERRRKAEV